MFALHAPAADRTRNYSGGRCAFSFGDAFDSSLRAGAVFLLVLVACSVALYDESPWKVLRMIAATAMGPGALSPADVFDGWVVAKALALHFGFCVLAGTALATLVASRPRLPASWVGLAFGAALYMLDMHAATIAFPWLAELRAADTLAAHLLFGLLAAQGYADRATGWR